MSYGNDTIRGELAEVPPGDFVELGVGGGDSARTILEAANGRRLFCYDTFNGFPLDTVDEGYNLGLCQGIGGACTAKVKTELESLGAVCVPGVFPATFWKTRPKEVAFVHLDADTYIGTKSGLDLFAPLLVENGFFMVHDYYAQQEHMQGVHRAVHEFLSENPGYQMAVRDNSYVRIWK